ncbi:hypothetical protein [Actinomadura hibisca]|uniref:hypothetical protein n=1 Tax=Actinomadura hibisca TaxID=68565 RepID=UPI0012FC9AB5|nr:hypothetical protein [Actinomadura hibisca]
MTSPAGDGPPSHEPSSRGAGGSSYGEGEPPSREELDRQVRGHYGNWRDQPRGLACAVVAAFAILTTVAFALVVLALLAAL